MFVLDDDVTDYFGAVFQKLLVALHAFYLPRILQKRKRRKDGTIPRKHLLDLTEPAKADYVTVSSFIDQAIVDLESESSNAACSVYNTNSGRSYPDCLLSLGLRSAATLSHSDSSLKRAVEEPDDMSMTGTHTYANVITCT